MSDSHAILTTWTGAAFEPRPGMHLRKAREAFGEGELVVVEAMYERSMRSHRHQFAAITDAWGTLPERLADMPYAASPETLRKHALIECGYADVTAIDAGSKAAAGRVQAHMLLLATKAYGYAVARCEGPMVVVATPQSQSVRAMGARKFQESKDHVLGWIEGLLAGERQRA